MAEVITLDSDSEDEENVVVFADKVASSSSSSSSSAKATSRERFLGCIFTRAYSMISGSNLIRSGDQVEFKRQQRHTASVKPPAKKQKTSSGSSSPAPPLPLRDSIIRFYVNDREIGRLTGETSCHLAPIFDKIHVGGECLECPVQIKMHDPIVLKISVYLKQNAFSSTPLRSAGEESALSTTALKAMKEGRDAVVGLFKAIGIKPRSSPVKLPDNFDLYSMDTAKRNKSLAALTTIKTTEDERASEKAEEDEIDAAEVEKIYSEEAADLDNEEIDPPAKFISTLRAYQKRGLNWLIQREVLASASEDQKQRMHPLWEEYVLPDSTVCYLNPTNGVLSLKFPANTNCARGGILADEMGLGKTVQMIALIVANPIDKSAKWFVEGSGTEEKRRRRGGNLVVAPMSMLSQWRDELLRHVAPKHLSVEIFYGGDRTTSIQQLSGYDVIITTYGVVSSEFIKGTSVLHDIHWHRIILDEAHTIKGKANQVSKACFALSAERRWCVTGTPIQNSLVDMFSLLHFLRLDPWSDWAWFSALIAKPYKDGLQQEALSLLRTVVQPLLLRRTKVMKEKDGSPLVVLPPRRVDAVFVSLSEAELGFYRTLYRQSKKRVARYFDNATAQKKTSYSTILELLLRLRQACDHPYLCGKSNSKAMPNLDKLFAKFQRHASVKDGEKSSVNWDDEEGDGEEDEGDIKEMMDEAEECPVCHDPLDDPKRTVCHHVACNDCLALLCEKEDPKCPVCDRKLVLAVAGSQEKKLSARGTFASLADKWISSSKVDALMVELEKLRSGFREAEERDKENMDKDRSTPLHNPKSIVFSQWTGMLDIVEIPLKKHAFKYVRLDGSSSQAEREKVLREFANSPDVRVFLISLRAGGLGLNLTAANHVFLLDPWWNPAVDDQAIDRVHRLGQKHEVLVKKLIIKDSLEGKILLMQEKKSTMARGVLGGGGGKGGTGSANSLTADDIKFIFDL